MVNYSFVSAFSAKVPLAPLIIQKKKEKRKHLKKKFQPEKRAK